MASRYYTEVFVDRSKEPHKRWFTLWERGFNGDPDVALQDAPDTPAGRHGIRQQLQRLERSARVHEQTA